MALSTYKFFYNVFRQKIQIYRHVLIYTYMCARTHPYMSQYFAFPLLCVLSLTCTHTLKLLDYYILAA